MRCNSETSSLMLWVWLWAYSCSNEINVFEKGHQLLSYMKMTEIRWKNFRILGRGYHQWAVARSFTCLYSIWLTNSSEKKMFLEVVIFMQLILKKNTNGSKLQKNMKANIKDVKNKNTWQNTLIPNLIKYR